MSETALVKLGAARRALEEARSLDELTPIIDQAEALRYAAKKAGMGLEMQNDIAEIKVEAECRAGELLEEMDKAKGGNPKFQSILKPTGTTVVPVALEDLGISKMQSSRWQLQASLPRDKRFRYYASMRADSGEITSVAIRKFAKELKRQRNRSSRAGEAMALPKKVYNVILADPPWPYDNTIAKWGPAAGHYATMTLEQICSVPDDIGLRAAKNAVLFLWTTNPLLEDSFKVIKAWGFNYKTNIAWVKTELKKPGSGWYVRGRHELCLISVKGTFTPLDEHISPPIGSVIHAPVREHSRKPDELYEIIERLYPDCSYIELFARGAARKGWDVWGQEAGQSGELRDTE